MKKDKNKFDPRCHIGETHGIYTIVDMLDEKDKHGHYVYIGECRECGYKKYTHYGEFSSKNNLSVTCKHLTVVGDYIQKIKWNNPRMQRIFNAMKQRCYNKKDPAYIWYGAKGIKICQEWLNNHLLFEEWSLQNGYANNLTIDRIDENKDYCPDNCRWISLEDNSKYKSTTDLINVDGEIHTGRDWSKILGLGTNQINRYIKQYGIEGTVEFIKRYIANPNLRPYKRNESIYSIYMND